MRLAPAERRALEAEFPTWDSVAAALHALPVEERADLGPWEGRIRRAVAAEPIRLCMHPAGACATTPALNHNVQRGRSLAVLADARNEVAVIEPVRGREHPLRWNQRKRIRSATGFRALCGGHDNDLFEPLETGGPIPLTRDSALRLTYRCLLKGVWETRSQLAAYLGQWRLVLAEAERVGGRWLVAERACRLTVDIASEQLEMAGYRKARWDEWLTAPGGPPAGAIRHLAYRIPRDLHVQFALSDLLSPSHDLQGHDLTAHDSLEDPSPWLGVHVLPDRDGSTSVFLAVEARDLRGPLSDFFTGVPEPHQMKAALQRLWAFALRHATDQTLAVSNEWLNSLDDGRQGLLLTYAWRGARDRPVPPELAGTVPVATAEPC